MKSVSFSDSGLDGDIIFRDRTYFVFLICFLVCVVKLQAHAKVQAESSFPNSLVTRVLSLPPSYFTLSAVTMFFYVMRIEDWSNSKRFRTFRALHWKRDVSKEPFQFVLEKSYR